MRQGSEQKSLDRRLCARERWKIWSLRLGWSLMDDKGKAENKEKEALARTWEK